LANGPEIAEALRWLRVARTAPLTSPTIDGHAFNVSHHLTLL
jgi:hypothetical protein